MYIVTNISGNKLIIVYFVNELNDDKFYSVLTEHEHYTIMIIK